MGKSHQAGWVVLRGKRWYGYFRKRIINPITNEEGAKFVCIPLDLKTNMTKSEARDALRTEVTKSTGQNLAGSRVLKDSSTTFGWFVRNRYFPLREGELAAGDGEGEEDPDRTRPVGEVRGVSSRFDRQIHAANACERTGGTDIPGSCEQARSYLKSIFDEAIKQEFLTKDPSRKLRIPKNGYSLPQ